MSDKSANHGNQSADIEDDSATSSQEFELSGGLKTAFAFVFGIPAIVILGLLIHYGLRDDVKPSELGLGAALIFCLACLAIILIPWRMFGLGLKKVGPLEFREVISTQKQEQSESVTFLQNQIDQLKAALEKKVGSPVDAESSFRPTPSIALSFLVEKFLRNHSGRFFSPFKVKSWGSEQAGFEQLGSFSSAEITQALLTMLAANRVRTKLSKKGNTLYGVSRTTG
jgi:hypothetical protein